MALAPTINLLETNAAILHLLTLTAGTDVMRFVNNNEAITSRGEVFQPYPFSLILPVADGERQQELELIIDNVDGRLTKAIRELITPPLFKFEMIISVTPDVVERTIDFLRAEFISYNSLSIDFRLRHDNIMGRKFPASKYTPARYPDLFYA